MNTITDSYLDSVKEKRDYHLKKYLNYADLWEQLLMLRWTALRLEQEHGPDAKLTVEQP